MRQLTCQNITMAQFAEQLPYYGGSTTRTIDETRLSGAWDFTVAYALTFAQAFDRQLGLKMTVERRPGPVLVVDSADEKPTDD